MTELSAYFSRLRPSEISLPIKSITPNRISEGRFHFRRDNPPPVYWFPFGLVWIIPPEPRSLGEGGFSSRFWDCLGRFCCRADCKFELFWKTQITSFGQFRSFLIENWQTFLRSHPMTLTKKFCLRRFYVLRWCIEANKTFFVGNGWCILQCRDGSSPPQKLYTS